MSKRKIIILVSIALAVTAYAVFDSIGRPAGEERQALDLAMINAEVVPDFGATTETIGFFTDRVKRHPQDVVSLTMLGQRYINQARESGDVAGYQRAEAALLNGLVLLPAYTPAEARLASVYYAQHRFAEALELAEQVYERDPEGTAGLATIGDSHLALGNYTEAREAYRQLLRKGSTAPLLARIAQLDYLEGKTESALKLMERAAVEGLKSSPSRENVAWYLTRLGDLYFNAGRIDEAWRHYDAASRVFNNYYLTLAGKGKVRAAQGRYDEAIALYERAAAVVPQPVTLAALGDLYAKIGDGAQAQVEYDTVEFIAGLAVINEQVYNRTLVLFYADHDIKTEKALELARKELSGRKDIYGYDALAWALFRNDKMEEAAEAITRAMALGTQDANLYFHSGMIHNGLGNTGLAREHLRHALELNPGFSVLNADVARATLEHIEGQALGISAKASTS